MTDIKKFVSYVKPDGEVKLYEEGSLKDLRIKTDEDVQRFEAFDFEASSDLREPKVSKRPPFGDSFKKSYFTSSIYYRNRSPFKAREMDVAETVQGLYRIMVTFNYKPGSTVANDLFELRVGGVKLEEQIDFEDEGKDLGSDIKRIVTILGYYNHEEFGPFHPQLWASQEGRGTSLLKNFLFEVWRVK